MHCEIRVIQKKLRFRIFYDAGCEQMKFAIRVELLQIIHQGPAVIAQSCKIAKQALGVIGYNQLVFWWIIHPYPIKFSPNIRIIAQMKWKWLKQFIQNYHYTLKDTEFCNHAGLKLQRKEKNDHILNYFGLSYQLYVVYAAVGNND